MSVSKKTSPWPLPVYVCLAAMLVLLAGSVVFWRERMLFYDAAFISFRIINYGSLQIMEHRYGSFITQMIPLAGSALHLSLKAVLIAYSVSFPLFYLLVFLLLCRWRAFPLAILLTLYFTLFVSDTFFWTNNEVHQGTAWLFLWLGFVFRSNERKTAHLLVLLVSTILLPLAVFTHPLVIFSGVFLWGFLILAKRLDKLPVWLRISISVLLVLTVFCKQQMSRNGWYDADKISMITGADRKSLLAAFGNEMSLTFLNNLLFNYWLFPLLLLWSIALLIKQRKTITLIWLLGSLGVLYLLVCLSFPTWVSFHAESEWMTFSLIGVTPFVFYGLSRIRSTKAAWLLGSMFVVRFAYIGIATPIFVERQQNLTAMVASMERKNLHKVALIKSDTKLSFGHLDPWALPIESLYTSVLRGDRPQYSLIEVDSSGLNRVLSLKPQLLAGPWDATEVSALNNYYFQIDTTQVYQLTTLPELMH